MTARWFSAAAGSLLLAVNAAAAGRAMPLVRAEIVPTQPPSPRPEVIVASSGRGRDWERTGGSWDWRQGSWVWVEPCWRRRPARSARWIPADYVRRDGSWRYVPGHWSSQRVVSPPPDRARHALFLTGSSRARR